MHHAPSSAELMIQKIHSKEEAVNSVCLAIPQTFITTISIEKEKKIKRRLINKQINK